MPGPPPADLSAALAETPREPLAAAPTASGELLRAVFDHIPVMLLVADAAGAVRLVNREVEHVLGWPAADWSDPALAARSYPDADTAAAARAALRAADGAGRDVRMVARDGRVLHTVWSHVRLSDGSTVALGQDVTARRLLEEQLRQSGKLEAIGQLAGGVAHDFNNLLTVILGHVGLAQADLTADTRAHTMLEQARQAAEQATELTRHLLGFAHRTPPRRDPCALPALVDETVRLLRRTLDPRITFAAAHAGAGVVRADPGQLKQVLLNLCLNARDAMPEGGRLALETAEVVLPEPGPADPPGRRAGAFVRLRVCDTGVGMPPEVKARLFEPFFTTKPAGKGTGLGLSLVQTIVRQHDGWAECDSTPGHGTCFDVYLPRGGPGVPARPAAAAAPPPESARGSETVLLVDDEPMIRELGRSFLESHGYRVLLAGDGEEALAKYAAAAGAVDVVVLDLALPRMGGAAALRRLRELDPAVRVVIASGFAPERLDPADHPPVTGFIPKPYRPHELARAVRAALDARS